jgi:hypothetical protein
MTELDELTINIPATSGRVYPREGTLEISEQIGRIQIEDVVRALIVGEVEGKNLVEAQSAKDIFVTEEALVCVLFGSGKTLNFRRNRCQCDAHLASNLLLEDLVE